MPPAPTDLLAYPDWMEMWWTDYARRELGRDDLGEALDLLEREVAALSDAFTIERPSVFRDYTQRIESILAYGLFYSPQTFVRVRLVLEELRRRTGWQPDVQSPFRILDLGAGLGAAGHSAALWAHALAPGIDLTLDARDHSTAALRVNRQMADEITARGADLTTHTRPFDLRTLGDTPMSGESGYDLIIAAFSLNECFAQSDTSALHAVLTNLRGALAPGGRLLIMEPAFAWTAERIEQLRDELVAADTPSWHIHAPCPHHGACPLRAQGKYWCHEVRTWSPPASLTFLNRRLFRTVQELKFCFLVLATEPAPASPPGAALHLRLVAPMSVRKGALMTAGCTDTAQRLSFDLPTRGLSKPRIKELGTIERGDFLTLDALEMLNHPERRRIPGVAAIRAHTTPRATSPLPPTVSADDAAQSGSNAHGSL